MLSIQGELDGWWQVLGSLCLKKKKSMFGAKKRGMLSLAIRCSFSFRLTILRISPNSQEPTLLHKPVNADQGKMSSLYLPYLDYLKFWKLLERLSLYKSIAFWLFHNKILYCTSGNKLQLYLSTVSWGINLLWSKYRTKFLCWNSMSHENLSFFQVFSCGKKSL